MTEGEGESPSRLFFFSLERESEDQKEIERYKSTLFGCEELKKKEERTKMEKKKDIERKDKEEKHKGKMKEKD